MSDHITKRGYGQLQSAIREALRDNPGGLTCIAIAAEIDSSPAAIGNAVRTMQDIFIDRWVPNAGRNGWARVLRIVPEHAPMPSIKPSAYIKAKRQEQEAAAR